MGSIVRNMACPACREVGHDSLGNHLMIFEDGGKFCNHKHFHKSGANYYESADESIKVTDQKINGDIQYTISEFRALEDEGKLKDAFTRQLALAGMKIKLRWEVLNEEEKQAQLEEWDREVSWFDELKVKGLADRGIHGLVAKLYNVRVGHDASGKVVRHYYPHYEKGEMVGASVRTLPKDFRFGHLGKRFGEQDLFGMNINKQVADSGQRRNFCIVTGGQADAMAAQQMLIKEINRVDSMQTLKSLDNIKLFHCYSVNSGEAGVEELVNNRDELNKFKSIIFAFDNDETGQKLNLAAARMFRGKAKILKMPNGCKDPNDALKKGLDSDFVSAVFSAEEAKVNAKFKRVKDVREKAREIPVMGLPYWLKGFNKVTYGIRLHYLAVWGAGTGVGKTDTTLQHVKNLMDQGKDVVTIYLENQVDEVARIFAGMLVNKDFTAPPQTQEEIDSGEPVNEARHYTQQDLDDALDLLANQDRLLMIDLSGAKDVDAVMEAIEECLALGYQYFVIDNLTAFEHKSKKGDASKSVDAMDETMKRLGTFKDENPVNIFLLSHLIKVDAKTRVPHTHGGMVFEGDFRGAGSITFWANAVWGIERNTVAVSFRNKCITLYRNLKNRGIGHMVGSVVCCIKDVYTGKYTELDIKELPEVGSKQKKKSREEGQADRDDWDDGSYPRSNRSAPEDESGPSEMPVDGVSEEEF